MNLFKFCLFILVLYIIAVRPGFAIGMITHNISQAISKNLADNLIKPQLKVKNLSGSTLSAATDNNKKFLAFILQDGSLRVWDLELGVQRPRIERTRNKFTAIAIDAAGGHVVAGQNDGTIVIHDILSSTFKYALPAPVRSSVLDLSMSGNNVLIASYEDELVVAWDLSTRREKWRINLDDQAVKTRANHQYWLAVIDDEMIEVRSAVDGKMINRLSPRDEDIVFLGLGRKPDILYVAYENGEFLTVNSVSGAILDKQLLIDDLSIAATAGDNIVAAYSSDSEKLIVKNRSSGSTVNLTTAGKDVDFIIFNALQNQLFVIDEDGETFLFDAKTGKKLLRLISTKQGWTVLDSTGRFDTSEPGLQNVSWEVGKQEIELDKFSERYYEPGLLAKVLIGERDFINKKPAVVEQGIALPPKVQPVLQQHAPIISKPTQLNVAVLDQGGGIENINVFHNGKALDMQSAQISEKTSDGKAQKSLTIDIVPTDGPNTVKAVATNTQGIESESAELSFAGQAGGQAVELPSLRIVAIGINKYADPRLNLDYSVADATAIAHLLRINKLIEFGTVETVQLFNKDATKVEILKAIKHAGEFSQEDILSVYMAGHGLVIDDEWYFLPHEAKLQDAPEDYLDVGISAKEIKKILIGAKAQKILFMVDSCYSGAGLNAYYKLINNQRHMSRSLSRSVGIIVLAAARKNQEAAELTDLGHGLFTYVVKTGMEGKADLQPRNDKISAYEIVDFSKETIPKMSKKYVGTSQDPVAFRMGKDFEVIKRSK